MRRHMRDPDGAQREFCQTPPAPAIVFDRVRLRLIRCLHGDHRSGCRLWCGRPPEGSWTTSTRPAWADITASDRPAVDFCGAPGVIRTPDLLVRSHCRAINHRLAALPTFTH